MHIRARALHLGQRKELGFDGLALTNLLPSKVVRKRGGAVWRPATREVPMRAVSTISTHIVQSDDARYLTAKRIDREKQRIEREQQRIERDQQQIEREQRQIERLRPRTLREQRWIEIDQRLIRSARKRLEREQQWACERIERVERHQKVLDLRELGFKLQEIADQFALSRERVRQIIKREEQNGRRTLDANFSKQIKFGPGVSATRRWRRADVEAWEAMRAVSAPSTVSEATS